jgi:VIT1/CCC1 family predicted Fe2+/Mn2+ transporter
MRHREHHNTERVGWLRAAVLGANDGIVSTASLIIGIAAAQGDRQAVWLAGLAGLVAGAMSMAAGEYVSVNSQADVESADIEKEKRELAADPQGELMELAGIYVKRGLEPKLAREVAVRMTEHDALGAHVRDELGINEVLAARPVQAAVSSALSFAVGAVLPLLLAMLVPVGWILPVVGAGSLIFLAVLGAVAARAGGAHVGSGALRVLFWGAMAMAATALVGALFGTTTS